VRRREFITLLGGAEKREPVSDIDTGVVDGLKVLDPDDRLEKGRSCYRADRRGP
jgi:hypothetical protein